MSPSSLSSFINDFNDHIQAHCNDACALPHWGVIECLGDDAGNFLHNQLTQDVLNLPASGTTFAAFCNAKGRIQASFYVFKGSSDHLLLILPKDLLAQTLKRLSMFVLRSKVKLTDASQKYRLLGLIGERADAFLHEHAHLASSKAQTLKTFTSGTFQADHPIPQWSTIHPGHGLSRVLICAPEEHLPEALRTECRANVSNAWTLGEILCGVPLVSLTGFEHYVPQMLNYESVGGVSFQKGCYPGQEVVARSQFRGTLKRRCVILFSSHSLQANQALYDSSLQIDQPLGEIVQSVQWGEIHLASACLQLQIFEADPTLRQGAWEQLNAPTLSTALKVLDESSAPHELGLIPLPYSLMKDI